jgi:hypothetical protein
VATDVSVQSAAWLAFLAVLFGVALHPFQFAMTQALEGYWGLGIGLRLAHVRILRYRRLVQRLEDAADASEESWIAAVEADRGTRDRLQDESDEVRARKNLHFLDAELGDAMLDDYLRAQASRSSRALFPDAARRILPTRLGNALRRYEDRAGMQYGLDILRIAPHLNLVAAKEHRAYVDDTRKGLDLGVRLCVVSILAALVTVILLIDDGAWILLALLPYAIGYLAYRGAVASAHAYGVALSTLVDLNRFPLYDALGLPRPLDTASERVQNSRLRDLLASQPTFLTYARRGGR